MTAMPRQAGFTLIELLTVVTLIAITLTIGVPGLIDFFRNNQIIASTNNLNLAINQTRSEAVNRGHNVVLCRSTNPNATPPSCGGGTAQDWSTGMIIFADTDEDGAFTAGTDELVARFDAVANNVVITSDPDAEPSVTYTQDGTLGTPTSPLDNQLLFAICDDRDNDGSLDGAYGRLISISAIGRPTLTKGGVGCTPL
jgi:type IV fimbrial biogenesis protein FimT